MTTRTARLLRACVVLALVGWARIPIAESHESSTSYLTLNLSSEGALTGTLDVGVFDLSWSILLDSDFDGRVLWKEVTAARPEIDRLVDEQLALERGGVGCLMKVADVLVTRHVGEPYLSLALKGQCSGSGPIKVRSDLLFDEDSGHRTLLEVHTPGGASNGFLAERSREWSEPAGSGGWTTFAAFVREGIWHVWTGYDHLAFLLSLLLPCALVASGKQWRPMPDLRPVISDLLRVVTSFTIAHSITLGLATLHVVTVSPRIIEPLIAVTIVVSALFNLFPALARLRLTLAFSFGLIHGFGFALALSEISQATGRLIALLAGFNIGVELAQLSVVLLVAPAIVLARHSQIYATRLMPAASLSVAVSGLGWLAVRLGG